MNIYIKRIVSVFVAITVPGGIMPVAWAYRDWDSTPMEVDAVALRPMGIGATALGIAAFIVSLPFAIITGKVEEAADQLVGEPFRFTFERPMGSPTTTYEEEGW